MLYLLINGEKIIRDDNYEMSIDDKLSESSGETEAGTKQYDYVRKNVHHIALSYTVTDLWLKKFALFRNMDTLNVTFFNELTGRMDTNVAMKMMDFSFDKIGETANRNIWHVSFILEEI